jgi:hypothetical protein
MTPRFHGGGEVQGFFAGNIEAIVIKNRNIWMKGSKIVKSCLTSFMDDPFLRQFLLKLLSSSFV